MFYEEVVDDFARRTLANLAAIDRLRAEGQPVYEATQLFNSLLGLIVFPQQQYFDTIPKTSLSELRSAGWPKPLVEGDFPDDLQDLHGLMRYLRNGITHYNLRFYPDINEEIGSVRVSNKRGGKENWHAILTLEELRKLIELFLDVIKEQKQSVKQQNPGHMRK